ncbi:Phosphotyrosine protein phosphatases superfamily protein [Hibiscus syriacus]|uniref:Phosphotyrosine protein phosphatases superfamily protein n=1 Tax=Hibiscus syriacus TaxID=106335 RepID=A0A6A2YEG9_HIBSY|nr:Phosphotyrosine protein phosphatases superfamily protein [Hibiscus syriacus]
MGSGTLTTIKKTAVMKVRNICPSSMADSYPRFTTGPSTTRANISMCRNNYSNNYVRFVGKLLFFAFFLIAIPSFPSQAPDFVNQTIFNNVANGNLEVNTQSFVSGMFHVSSIFEDGFSNVMYYSGQGNAGNFIVKKGGFESPYEENVDQAWSSKYFQGEPTVVLAQPNCGLEKYGESSSFVDYKPLGLPVRSLRSRVARRAIPEFGNGSSEPSGSHMKDSSQGSNESRDRGFGGFASENLEGKLNESDVLHSPITRPSRSRWGDRVHSNVTYQGSDNGSSESSGSQINDSYGSSNKSRSKGFCDLGSENLEKSNDINVLGSSISQRSRSGRTRVRVHSNVTYEGYSNGSRESSGSQMKDSPDSSNKSACIGFGDLGSENLEKFNESDVVGSSIPEHSRSGRMKKRVHRNVTYEGFGNGSSESSGSNKSKGRAFGDLYSENLEKFDESDVLGSLIPPRSRSGRMRERAHSNVAHEGYGNGSSSPIPWLLKSGRMRERVHCNVTRPSHFRPLSVDETQFESLKSGSLRSTVSFSSQVSSQSQSPSSLSPSHSSSSESPKSKMSELVKERCPRRSFPPTSPLVLKPMSKASVDASHSRQYVDRSLLGTPARKCFKDELKELCDSKKVESLGSKEQISGSFNFDAKPAAPSSKASSRGKSVRTFRTSRASVNTTSSTDAEERQEDCSKGKQNLVGESHMPKLTSTEIQKKEIQHCQENPTAERGEDSERENDNFQVNSDEETMSGTFSIVGSEVDRKAGEFIAKFREQIRLQRATSVDTPRGLNITGNYFR